VPDSESLATAPNPVTGLPWVYVRNVSRPTLTVYSPNGKNTGAAIVVFPGGGYQILAMDLEGTEVCDWLTSQRAVGLVRLHAADWHVDPHKIGVLGFSAGGHLVAAISNHFQQRLYAAVDAADKESCRPDFAVALYPGHLWIPERGQFGFNPDIHVTRNTPPTFLLQAETDTVDNVNQALVYYIALKNVGVPTEMHLYADGGHAFGLRRTKDPITEWPHLVERWLRTIGMISD
jgi:acetyl esterase/lipase